jgi:hypothetical protein
VYRIAVSYILPKAKLGQDYIAWNNLRFCLLTSLDDSFLTIGDRHVNVKEVNGFGTKTFGQCLGLLNRAGAGTGPKTV